MKTKSIQANIILKTFLSACILSLFFLSLHRGFIALGILIGALTGIGCFALLAKDVLASTNINYRRIKPYFFLKYIVRYVIMGLMLFLCAKVNFELFLGAAAGVLLIYLVIFLTPLIDTTPLRD